MSSPNDSIAYKIQARLDRYAAELASHRSQLEEHQAYLSNNGESTSSPRSPDGPRVEDRLMTFWKASQEKIENQRTQKIQSEREALSSPQLSKKAQNIKSEVPVYVRLIERYASSQEKLEKERTDKEVKAKEAEQGELTLKPKISKHGERVAGRNVDAIYVWDADRQRRIEQLRQEKQASEAAEARFEPDINRRSAKLASKSRREGERVEDHLLEYDMKRRLHLLDLQTEVDAVENPGHPQITERAAALKRNGNPFDRLYEMASDIEEKRRRCKAELDPSLNSSPTRSQSAHPEDVILKRSEESKRKIQAKWEVEMAKLYAPAKMNPTSEYMANRMPSSSWDRLLSPKVVPAPRDPDFLLKELAECTFHPKIDGNSKKLSSKVATSYQDRGEYLHAKSRSKIEKLQRMREENEQRMLSECTFRPQRVSTTSENRLHHEEYDVDLGDADVVERLSVWAKRKDERIHKEREAKDAREVQECTFQPMTPSLPSSSAPGANDNSGYSSPSSSRSLNEDDVPGLEDFLRRQEKARVLREQSKVVPHASGENWTPELTVPVEPRLSSRSRSRGQTSSSPSPSIRSLQKPVSPMIMREALQNVESGTDRAGSPLGMASPSPRNPPGSSSGRRNSSGPVLAEGAFSTMLFAAYANRANGPQSARKNNNVSGNNNNDPRPSEDELAATGQVKRQEYDEPMNVHDLASPGPCPPEYAPVA
eukprot:ANDGO_00364.mRNA.1 hypothetical protein